MASEFFDKLANMTNDRNIAKEICAWVGARLLTADADAITTIFTNPSQAGKDAGISRTQTPQVAEIFDLMIEATAHSERLGAQAVVSLLVSTLPLRSHPERKALVGAVERRLKTLLPEDCIDNTLRGLR